MPKKVIQKWHVGLICLTGFTILLRLWRLSEFFHFTYDEEVFAFIGKRMWVNHHLPLIGGVTPMHVHVAPYFYWFSGFFLGLGRLNPLVWGYLGAGIAAVTLIFLYITGAHLFNRRVGLIAGIFYTFSFLQNILDRHYWGLSFDGLWGLLTLYSLHKIIKGNTKYTGLLAGVFFLALHTDLSTLVVYLLTGLVLVLLYLKPNWFRLGSEAKAVALKTGLIAGSAFILSLLPLIIFDIRHNLSNSRGILQYMAEVGSGRRGNISLGVSDSLLFLPRILVRTLYVFGDTDLAKQYSYCTQHQASKLQAVPTVMAILVTMILGFAIYQGIKKKRIAILLLFLLFGSTYAGIVIYGVIFRGDLFDHYVVTLLPPFYLILAFLLDRFRKYRLTLVSVIVLFVFCNTQLLTGASHRFGFKDKMTAVNWAISETGPSDFSLDVIGDCFKYAGYRYLFYLAGKEPVKSYVDANFTYLYDRPPSQTHPPFLVVITNPDTVETDEYKKEYAAYKNKLLKQAQFGNIEVLLVDNSHLDFVGKF